MPDRFYRGCSQMPIWVIQLWLFPSPSSSSLDGVTSSSSELLFPVLSPLMRGISPSSLLVWQSMQTLCFLVGWMWSITARCLEHELQTKKPHFRQWCRRLVWENLLKQRMHLKAAWSGIQVTAKAEPGWRRPPCSRLDLQSSMCSIQARFSSNEAADTKKDLRGVRISHWFLISTPSSMSSSWMSSETTMEGGLWISLCTTNQWFNCSQLPISAQQHYRQKLEFGQFYPLLQVMVSSAQMLWFVVFSNINHLVYRSVWEICLKNCSCNGGEWYFLWC